MWLEGINLIRFYLYYTHAHCKFNWTNSFKKLDPVLQVSTLTATFLPRSYSTLLAFVNCSSMCIFRVSLYETWRARFFTVFKWSSFGSMILKFRQLPLKVNFVHLSRASSILFFLTHFWILSRSCCVSQYDFLIESTFKLSAQNNGSEKVRTSGRWFKKEKKRKISNKPGSDPRSSPLVTSRVLELQLSILQTACDFQRSWSGFQVDTCPPRFGRPFRWINNQARCQRL